MLMMGMTTILMMWYGVDGTDDDDNDDDDDENDDDCDDDVRWSAWCTQPGDATSN